MPGTRRDYIQRYGIDPWRSPDEAVHAAEIFLKKSGLEGYNPGGGQHYVRYILGQKVGPVGRSASSGPAVERPGPSALRSAVSQRTTTLSLPGPQVTPTPQVTPIISSSNIKGPQPQLVALPAPAPQPPGTTVNIKSAIEQAVQGHAGAPAGGVGRLGRIIARANKVDAARPGYLWGGGHGRKPAKLGVPVDCSGAVSQLLGVNPRVSGQFEKFGKPGRGRKITIYAKGSHVLAEVNGHFWGTSQTNPGGGAGWIPRSAISAAYLKGFTARHPAGL